MLKLTFAVLFQERGMTSYSMQTRRQARTGFTWGDCRSVLILGSNCISWQSWGTWEPTKREMMLQATTAASAAAERFVNKKISLITNRTQLNTVLLKKLIVLHWTNQEIPRLLWNSRVLHCSVYKISSMVPTLSQMNPACLRHIWRLLSHL
jgi:hypothetical protein